MFKKGAPEPLRKKYGRIVNGESIVDQIINRMILSGYLNAEGSVYPHAPNLKGMGFNLEHAELILGKFEAQTKAHGSSVKSDVEKWEIGFSDRKSNV